MYHGGMAAGSAGTSIGVIMIMYILFLGVMMIGSIADYIIRGIGMYKMGKAEGKTNSWMAFIPFARTYFQGELSGSITLKKKQIKSPGVWMIVVPIIYGVVVWVMYAIFAMLIIASTFSTAASQGHYSSQDIETATGMIVIMIVFILIFALITTVFTAVMKVLRVLVNRQIYDRYTVTNMAVLHAVLGTIIPFYESVCLFIFGRRAEALQEPQIPQGQQIPQEPQMPQEDTIE